MGSCQALPCCEKDFVKVQELQLKCVTWLRDSNALFDYESQLIVKHNFKINESGYLIRQGGDIIFHRAEPFQEVDFIDGEVLFQVVEKNGHVSIIPCGDNNLSITVENEKEIEQLPWLIAKPSLCPSPQGHVLQKGDLIRFGKVKFRVKDINAQGSTGKSEDVVEYLVDNYDDHNASINNMASQNVTMRNTVVDSNLSLNLGSDVNQLQQAKEVDNEEEEEQVNKACRICLCEDEEPDNPIVQPCKCSGTMKNIHVKCFKKWIGKQVLQKQSSNLLSFYWKKLQCELCHCNISHIVETNGVRFYLVEMPRLNQPHIILESFMNDRSKGFHVLKFSPDKDIIKLGRGYSCDIRINDISVSRVHGAIKFHRGNFYIQDLNSKFGTLLLYKQDQIVSNKASLFAMQIGRSIVECRLRTVKKKGQPNGPGLHKKNTIVPEEPSCLETGRVTHNLTGVLNNSSCFPLQNNMSHESSLMKQIMKQNTYTHDQFRGERTSPTLANRRSFHSRPRSFSARLFPEEGKENQSDMELSNVNSNSRANNRRVSRMQTQARNGENQIRVLEGISDTSPLREPASRIEESPSRIEETPNRKNGQHEGLFNVDEQMPNQPGGDQEDGEEAQFDDEDREEEEDM